MGGQRHDSITLSSGKIAGTNFTGGWVVLGAGVDEYGKYRPPPGFETRTV